MFRLFLKLVKRMEHRNEAFERYAEEATGIPFVDIPLETKITLRRDFNRIDVELPEFIFEQKKVDFPMSGGGAVIFKRSQLVRRMVDSFVTANEEGFSSFYFHHGPGTGKTVLLKLFGQELQRRGFVVYMLTAPEFNGYPDDYFEKLVAKLGDKPVAILVDEVQRNVESRQWNYLLKNAPNNLLVVGTGIGDLHKQSPQFLRKYPSLYRSAICQLTVEDMPEVLNYFIPKDDPQWELKTKALNELLEATGGQVFPFVRIAKHLLEPESEEHLKNLRGYLKSKEFFFSEVYTDVKERCYHMNVDIVKVLSLILLEKPLNNDQAVEALKSGLWDGTDLVSPLLRQEIFQYLLSSPLEKIELIPPKDEDEDKTKDETETETKSSGPLVEQVIAAGLANMTPLDFDEANYSNLWNIERGLAFRWGVCCGAALKEQASLWAEVVTKEKEGEAGAKPMIDFVVNGRLNIGLELAKDRSVADMKKKLIKIGEGGVYDGHNSYLFHFISRGTVQDAVDQVQQFPKQKQTRVYTFLRNCNSLLCGTRIVRKGVVPSLQPIGTKQFSTLALGALRRLGKLL